MRISKVTMLCIALLCGASSLLAKGVPWLIDVDSAADADGGTLSISITVERAGLPDGTIPATVGIGGGASKETKCAAIAAALDMSKNLTAACDGTTVKVEVQETSGYAEIKSITIDDSQTGEDLTGVKDEEKEKIRLMYAFIDFQNRGGGAGSANLQIGTGPRASVTTAEREPAAIAQALASKFNELYARTTFRARAAGEMVVVDNVPANVGMKAGASDRALRYSFGLAATGRRQ